jgi:hypothetical protein
MRPTKQGGCAWCGKAGEVLLVDMDWLCYEHATACLEAKRRRVRDYLAYLDEIRV